MQTTNSSSKKVSYIEASGKVYIQVNNVIPSWQTGFSCIDCAIRFVKTHNVFGADIDELPYNIDDFEWIVDTYGFEYDEGNMWVKTVNDLSYILQPSEQDLLLNVEGEKVSETYIGVESVLKKLDETFPDIIATSEVHGSNIFAASARDITKNMVRVKSSNLWSYTINIKNAGDKYGDVYITFKGRNGGPDGGTYVYYDVPIKLWRQFITAPSKGHFFHVYIRNNFKYRKLTGDKRTHLKNGIN